jgi:uncharacterized protein YgbK (DUF1537 family)
MPLITAIADDDTGATDLAGMLTSQGLRTIVVLDDCEFDQLQEWSRSADAVIVGTASRSIPRQHAYDRTYRAAMTLLRLNPQLIALKYCSTFDSTPEGNIGASIDAAMDATGELFTVALAALPALGRTTYMGYHFVHDKLLSDSVLRHHPLHPMTNSHLPSHLQSQTRRRVGSVTYGDGRTISSITERLIALQTEGVEIALLDCIDEAHLERNVGAIAAMRLITGSSGWATALPKILRTRGLLGPPATNLVPHRAEMGRGFLIVSGSCSDATRAQNRWMSAQEDCLAIHLDALALLDGTSNCDPAVATIDRALSAGRTCLLTTTEICDVAKLHAKAAQIGLTPTRAGDRISTSLACLVKKIVSVTPPQGLIVAGGETSSALMRSLELGGLRVGPNIEPGVPVCVALAMPFLGLALKSGNFGSPEFFAHARSAILNLPQGDLLS